MKRWVVVSAVLLAGCVVPPARVDVPRTDGPEKSCVIDLPVGWIRQYWQNTALIASRDGFALQSIRVTRLPLDRAFPRTKKKASETMLPSELAELQLAEARTLAGQVTTLNVLENEPALIDGRDGFKLLISYRTLRGLEIHHVAYGVADKSGYYRIEYDAPKLHYFDLSLGDFQKAVATFHITADQKTAGK